MAKSYFFAVQRFHNVETDAHKHPKMRPFLHLGKTAYSTPWKAMQANSKFVAEHQGEMFTIVGYDLDEYELVLGDKRALLAVKRKAEPQDNSTANDAPF